MENKNITEEMRDRLYEDGVTIYSFSRLMALKNCMHEFKFTYIDKIKGKDNIWSKLGSALHDCLERIYKNEIDESQLVNEYFKEYDKIVEEGYKFPTDTIHENTTKAVNNFLDNFKKKDYRQCECERFFLTQVEGHWLQGYIDLIVWNDDGTVSVVDYKVSSKFSKKDLIDKGKQLTLYAYALEKQGYKVKNTYFNMLKYVNLKWNIGRKKSPLTERKNIWDASNKQRLLLACEKHGMTEDQAIELWLDLYQRNSLDVPEWLNEYLVIEDGLVEWEYNEENLNELKSFVRDSVNELEKETEYKPVKIDSKTSFYCSNLCGHSSRCSAYQKYLESLPVRFDDGGSATISNITLSDLF